MFYHRPVNLHVHINLQLIRGEGQQDLTYSQDFPFLPCYIRIVQLVAIDNVPKKVKLGTKLEWFGQIKQNFYPSVHRWTGENENTKITNLSYS